MSGFNSDRNGNFQKKKWETVITVVALSLCAVGLAAASVISYFQTMYAFLPLNDKEIPMIGNYIAVGMAFIFQYGQNAALYYKNRYATGGHAFTFLLWNVTDKAVCSGVFLLCAVIDGGTNILWLQGQANIADQKWYFQLLYFAAMIAVVFVEEVLGKAIQIVAHAYTELQKILVSEQRGGGQPQPQNNHQQGGGKPKGSERRNELERQFQSGGGHHGQDRRGEKRQGPTTYEEMANRFHQEEE